MKRYKAGKLIPKKLVFSLVLVMSTFLVRAQYSTTDYQSIRFGLHFDPVIGWFGSDIVAVKNRGARPGYSIGLTFNKYFSPNYSFSSGISLMNVGGRLAAIDSTTLRFTNFNSIVRPGQPVIYKIQYLSIPVGLKLQTNEIGYTTFFSDLGLDPKVAIGGKATIPSIGIKNENASKELKMFNLGYHIGAGIAYSMGGTTALVLGLRYEKNFLDITKETGIQPGDRITHNLINFRLGINF